MTESGVLLSTNTDTSAEMRAGANETKTEAAMTETMTPNRSHHETSATTETLKMLVNGVIEGERRQETLATIETTGM